MPDPVLELREADPAAHARTAPPRDVLRAIVATPLQAPRPPRRRAPRIALGAAPLAAAAVVAFAALPGGDNAPGPIRASLAERAFAATAPQPDFITYTETTTVQTGNPRTESYDKLRQWQYGDRMHNFMETRQPRGEWVYEHDQNGATIRTLMRNDKGGKESRSPTRPTRAGTRRSSSGFKAGVTTLVERVPRAIRGARGPGGDHVQRQARPRVPVPSRARKRCRPATPIYYVDPETAEPLGSKMTITSMSRRSSTASPCGASRPGRSRSRRPSTATTTSSRRPRTWSSSTRRTSTRRSDRRRSTRSRLRPRDPRRGRGRPRPRRRRPARGRLPPIRLPAGRHDGPNGEWQGCR